MIMIIDYSLKTAKDSDACFKCSNDHRLSDKKTEADLLILMFSYGVRIVPFEELKGL